MDEDARRIAAARVRNQEYLRRLDEEAAHREADEFLKQHVGDHSDPHTNSERAPHRKPAAATTGAHNAKHTSVYITGLTTYMACKQLEGVCAKIGKVRRIKFYKDDRGGLKGDALVTFASYNMMLKAVERLNHLEIKPGVLLTATEAQFTGAKEPTSSGISQAQKGTDPRVPVPVADAIPDRLFNPELLQSNVSADIQSVSETQETEANATAEPSFVPSRSVILHHVWDPLAPQDDATQFFTELEDDMRQECGKHGRVLHVHILPTGAVMIRYETLPGAIQCRQLMHSRWFDGRQLDAQFDPSTPEDPEDDATKLDAFFASLA